MITTGLSLKAGTDKKPAEKPHDESREIPAEELALIQWAMSAGLTDFTIPTKDSDWKRSDWTVRTWVISRGGKPAAHLVASCVGTSIEIFGPEISLGAPPPPPPSPPKPDVLQKR